MENPLLKDPVIFEKYKTFSKKNYKIKQNTIKRRVECLENNEEYVRKNDNPESIYKYTMKLYPSWGKSHKVYSYLSSLNNGKIKTINQQKLNEYHITFNEDLKKFVADKEYIKSLNVSP